MIQNYFFLNRLILEANALLKGARILEIFSQEKGTLTINCGLGNDNSFIELSVIPGNAYLNIKNKFSRAKKNTISFFNDAIDNKIISFGIADDDRIINLKLDQSDIYFAIRGKFTNVFYLSKESQFLSFKSMDEQILSETKKEFINIIFLSEWNRIKLDVETKENYLDEIRKKYPTLGSDIIKEVKARSNNSDHNTIFKLLDEVLEEIRNSKPCVFIDKDTQEIKLGFENFKSFPFTEKIIFGNSIEAQNFLLSKEYYLKAKHLRLKLIRNHLEREMNKVSSKIQNLQGVIEKGSKEAEYNKLGKLLLANLGALKIGMNSISVYDILTEGKKMEISLSPKLSPQKNVEYYFDKSKSEKISFAKTQELFINARKEFLSLKKIESSFNEIESVKELDEIMKELKIKPLHQKEDKDDIVSKFKHYLIDGKYNLFVGKDSKNNDLLTTRFAKQNDYWFHARGASGSHVVLRVENTKESIPKNVLKKAAAIAAYHSKAKTSGTAPVAYTLKKYVVKKKGYPVGTVHLLREDVLLVKPEIPAGCEYITDN